jgi:hypothetical protein
MALVANNDHDRLEARQVKVKPLKAFNLSIIAMTAEIYRTQHEVMNCFDHHQCVVCGGQYTHETLLECPDIPHHRRNAVRTIVRNRGKYKKFAQAHGLPAAVNAFTNNPYGLKWLPAAAPQLPPSLPIVCARISGILNRSG